MRRKRRLCARWEIRWRQGKYMALGVLMMAGICLADYTVIGKYAFRFWISAIGINAGCKLLACAEPGRFFLNGVSWFWTTSWFWGSLILPAYAAVVCRYPSQYIPEQQRGEK